jgi:hypothetical protein
MNRETDFERRMGITQRAGNNEGVVWCLTVLEAPNKQTKSVERRRALVAAG